MPPEQALKQYAELKFGLTIFNSDIGNDKTPIITNLIEHHYKDSLVAIVNCTTIREHADYYPIEEIFKELNIYTASGHLLHKDEIFKKLKEIAKKSALDYINIIPVVGAIIVALIRTIIATTEQFQKKTAGAHHIRTSAEIHEAQMDELRRLATNAPLLLFVNNLQWADDSSLDFISAFNESFNDEPFPISIILNYTLKNLDETKRNKFKTYIRLLGTSQHKKTTEWPVPPPELKPVGREQDIERVCEALKQKISLAITGIAGIGKTTVLAHAVHRIAAMADTPYTKYYHYPITESDSRTDRLSQILLGIITTLDPQARIESADLQYRYSKINSLIDDHSLLLIIENADDLESQSLVGELHRSLPELVIVITSNTTGWRDFLTIPLEGISPADGETLFAEIYKKPIGCITSIMELCERVHGHPMMITHIADDARENDLPLENLTDIIPDFDVDRHLARRFDSIRERLPMDCCTVLDLVALMFTATLRSGLVREVTNISLNNLELMEDRHLIRIHADKRAIAIHPLIRAWSRRHLSDDPYRCDDYQPLLNRVIGFYIQYFKEHTPENNKKMAEIDDEWPNILGLVDKYHEPNLILTLLDEAIGDHVDDPKGYIPRRSHMASILYEPESAPRGEKIAEYAKTIGGLLAARIEKNLGIFYYWTGDYDNAEALFLRSRDRYRIKKDIVGEIATTWLLGYLADDENIYRDAEMYYKRGTELAEKYHPLNDELRANGYHLIACTYYHQGHYKRAEEEWKRALGLIIDNSSGSRHLLERIYRRLGAVSIKLKKIDAAADYLGKALNLSKILERPRDTARLYRQYSLLHLEHNELREAEECVNKALEGFIKINAVRGIGYTKRAKSILKRKQEKLKEAQELCEESRQIAEKSKSLYGEASAYVEHAKILEARGEPQDASNGMLRKAYNILSIIGHQEEKGLREHLEKAGALKPPLPQNIKGVVFDLMDTLAYLEKGVYEANQKALADELEVSADRFRWAWSESRKKASMGLFKTTGERIEFVARQLQIGISEDVCNSMAHKVESMWNDHVKLYPGTKPLLEKLQNLKLLVAIISNGPVAMERLCEILGLADLIECFILSSQAGALKPETSIYERAVNNLNLDYSECIFVGDGNDHEFDGARKVELFAVKIRRTMPPYSNIKNQSMDWDREIDDLGELISLFQT